MAKLKLLLDENIGTEVFIFLERQGYDVVSVLDKKPGIEDREVLEQAQKDRRIVITLDKDFGRLIYRNSQRHAGVILLRLDDESPRSISQTLARLLVNYNLELSEKFTVVTETKVRLRR